MWVGANNLRHNYAQKILPTIRLVEARGTDQIVVTAQTIAQEMAALMRDHRFYLVPVDVNQSARLTGLADEFLRAGRRQFLVIDAVEPDTDNVPDPTLISGPGICWTRRRLGANTVGYLVYEFSLC